ncbi:MAG: hypothetical protein JWN70_2735 [Planctomycetaceae bacterium]|nr:hypothetical protein [Planctomycetaceae bacterium]
MIAITRRADLLQSLKRQLRQISGGEIAPGEAPEVNSTGFLAVDKLLPQGGIPKGGMIEWLTASAGAGAATLALAGVRAALNSTSALSHSGHWVVIDPHGDFFPPAVRGWGIPEGRLLLIRPATSRDAAWAFEQALRCPGVAVTWNWVGPTQERVLQRWKVAAEVGRGQGVLFRSEQALKQASWADVRWLVQPIAGRPDVEAGRRLRLELAYCRGALGGERVEVECNDETGLVRVVPELADPAPRRLATRA